MISLRIASWTLLVVGAVSAAAILVASINASLAGSMLTLWILTAGGFATGFVLPALADAAERSAFPLAAMGGAALLLSMASLVALLIDALGIFNLVSTANLWLLAGGGLILGPLALTAAQALKSVQQH